MNQGHTFSSSVTDSLTDCSEGHTGAHMWACTLHHVLFHRGRHSSWNCLSLSPVSTLMNEKWECMAQIAQWSIKGGEKYSSCTAARLQSEEPQCTSLPLTELHCRVKSLNSAPVSDRAARCRGNFSIESFKESHNSRTMHKRTAHTGPNERHSSGKSILVWIGSYSV